MSDPYLGQIQIFGFNFAPRGWAFCDGQILPINQNQSLYSILGTTYGGDGRTSFALPDLRGRVPMQQDAPNPLGRRAGQESVSLTAQQMGQHGHAARGSSNTAAAGAAGKVLGTGSGAGRGAVTAYVQPGGGAVVQQLENGSIAMQGSGAGHDNIQPSLVLSFCIAVTGLFPPRN